MPDFKAKMHQTALPRPPSWIKGEGGKGVRWGGEGKGERGEEQGRREGEGRPPMLQMRWRHWEPSLPCLHLAFTAVCPQSVTFNVTRSVTESSLTLGGASDLLAGSVGRCPRRSLLYSTLMFFQHCRSASVCTVYTPAALKINARPTRDGAALLIETVTTNDARGLLTRR